MIPVARVRSLHRANIRPRLRSSIRGSTSGIRAAEHKGYIITRVCKLIDGGSLESYSAKHSVASSSICHRNEVNRVHQILNLHISFLIFYGTKSDRLHNTSSTGSSIVIGYKNTISGGSSIMQPIRIPENTRNVIFVMNLIQLHDSIVMAVP